jgi:hypothetical protein
VALSATIRLDLGTTLLFTGLYNVVSGIAFRIPMYVESLRDAHCCCRWLVCVLTGSLLLCALACRCVQPMKTIAAVALAAPGAAARLPAPPIKQPQLKINNGCCQA